MALSDEHYKFPKPDHPQRSIKSDSYPKSTLGTSEVVFKDGRPCLIEIWLDDEDMDYCSRTFFYSADGIEDWDAARHQSYISDHEIVDERAPGQPIEFICKKIMDASNNLMWCVSPSWPPA